MIQETSTQAYFTEVLPTLADRHQQVLKALATVENATNSELSRMLGWEINRVTPRVNELVHPKDKNRKPLVEEAGKRQCRITGRTAIAWRAVISRPSPANDPKNYRCTHPGCPKTGVTYFDSKPVCLDHSKEKIVAPSLF